MEDPEASTRVEIELTPNEAARPWRRRSGGAATVEYIPTQNAIDSSVAAPELEQDVVREDPPHPVDRRKFVVACAVVAVVALFIGWALGRTGGSTAGDASQPSPTTEASPSETLPLAVVPSTVPATTRPPVVRAGPTTTTAPRWETMTVDVDDSAAALDIRVVVVGGGRIAEIDTGSGEMRTLATGTRYSQPPLVNAGEDWIVIRNTDTGRAQLVRTGELPVDVDVGDPWSTQFQRDTGLFWRISSTDGSGPSDVVEIDHEGVATGQAFQLPSQVWPMAGDPSGGVVVGAPGGTYHIGLDGARRLTTGNLLSLSARVAVVTDCGEDFGDCGVYVVDRATGQRTKLDVRDAESGEPIPVFNLQNAAFWGNPELLGAVSPDDRWAPVMVTGRTQQLGLLDLTTGEVVPFPAFPPSALWWSPDSRSAIYIQNNRLMLFDTVLNSWTDIAPASIAVDAFAVRP